MNFPPSLSIRAVAKRTGLSPFVIRSWERRYGLADPVRSAGGHRLYSEAEVERLALLSRAVKTGLSIGNIVHLPDSELIAMLSKGDTPPLGGFGRDVSADMADRFAKEMVDAVKEFNGRRLNRVLDQAKVALGWQGLIERVLSPAAAEIGRLWQTGEMTTTQEHFFSAAVKTQLKSRVHVYAPLPNAPRIVVGAPVGQVHKLGAVLTANAAANMGWEVAYAGAGIPAEELAGTVKRFGARALAISLTFPEGDPVLLGELHDLGRLIPEGTQIIAGGQAASSYRSALDAIGASICGPLSDFVSVLNSIA